MTRNGLFLLDLASQVANRGVDQAIEPPGNGPHCQTLAGT